MSLALVHPSSGACDLFVELFHVLYCSGTMCVGVTVWFGWVVWYPDAGCSGTMCAGVTLWFGWGGVASGCRLKHYSVVHATLHA